MKMTIRSLVFSFLFFGSLSTLTACAGSSGDSQNRSGNSPGSPSIGNKDKNSENSNSFWKAKIACSNYYGRNNLYTQTSLRYDGNLMFAILDIRYTHFSYPWTDLNSINLKCTEMLDHSPSSVFCESEDKNIQAKAYLTRNRLDEVGVSTDIPVLGGENLGDSFSGCQKKE